MEPKIKVYGTTTCPDTQRARKFLGEHGVPYSWIDVDADPEGLRFIQSANNGASATPTILFDDGSVLVEPTDEELAAKLGL